VLVAHDGALRLLTGGLLLLAIIALVVGASYLLSEARLMVGRWRIRRRAGRRGGPVL
jgi:hypothetical protein